MSGLVVVLLGAGTFVFVTAALAVLIWTLAPASTTDESRIVSEMLRTRYELDLLAREARERIAQVRSGDAGERRAAPCAGPDARARDRRRARHRLAG